jgi:superfamily I DNA and/or RNA helicase
MENFEKSILNYFAAFTETRFNFQKKTDYQWTDNTLTVDFSVFPEFQNKILTSIKDGNQLSFEIKKGEYAIALEENIFKQVITNHLETSYNLEYLKNCLQQSQDDFQKKYADRIILSGKDGNQIGSDILEQENIQREIFLDGTRKFNLSFRKCIKDTLVKLQKDKLEQLKAELRFKHQPMSSLNPLSIEQKIFDLLQELAQKESKNNLEKYFSQIKEKILQTSFELTIFDLYSVIRKFTPFTSSGNIYIFFHEMFLSPKDEAAEADKKNKKATDKYPLFLIEVEIDELADKLILKSNRDIVIINTPAINSFEFENILTTPRAARFTDARYYLGSVEKHLQNTYSIFEEFLLEPGFSPLTLENKPTIHYRIGLQLVQKENRKLLDYSELITHIEAGKGDKFIKLIKDYISGKVKNTADEVDTEYNTRYPKKSVNNLISTIPISLNKSQKRILTALENEKNKIIVVDGPPGTGKSYTIMAISYWATQKNKSVMITSHKKAALDVVENMMTGRFKDLHPDCKPSIMRISKDDISINNYQYTLSDPVISASSNRVNGYNEEAINKDQNYWYREIEKQNNNFWNNAENYPEYISKLLELEKIEKELKENFIIPNDWHPFKFKENEDINLELIQKIVEKIKLLKLSDLSLEQLGFLYQNSNLIPEWITACQNIDNLSVKEEDIDKLKNNDFENLDQFSNLFSKVAIHLQSDSLFFTVTDKLKYKSFITKHKMKNSQQFKEDIKSLGNLEYGSLVINISNLFSKDKSALTIAEIKSGISKLKEINIYNKNRDLLRTAFINLNLNESDIKQLFHLLNKIKDLLDCIDPITLSFLYHLKNYFNPILEQIGVDFNNLLSLAELFSSQEKSSQILGYMQLFIEINQKTISNLPDRGNIKEYFQATQKKLENINDKRIKDLNNYTNEKERIIVSMKAGKRLTVKEAKILLENIPCIIAEPDLISRYFPMEEDSIDLLVIDEASQVSIAESISLLLRAKQVVVFGDEYQYGAVGAINVNKKYSDQYFKEILDAYARDYQVAFDEKEKEKITNDISEDIDPEEQEVGEIYKPEEGTKEWLKTFSVRTSTLNFAKALKNYNTSLDVHFRSFPEIIEYSNEIFYAPSQIQLIINRIRTKPINEVLRFMKIDTKGNSGNNVNLDEIEAIKDDIQKLIANGFKGSIGIITSFREQRDRMEEILRKELSNYHRLSKKHHLAIWFIGDVQGEERDIIYYSLVEDKKIGNADLRTIFPVIGGQADDIHKLKMQRLNVGFSRAKDTIVIVYSMSLEDYANTRLGDALKIYYEIKEKAIDNYIADESIFGSEAEKDLYRLITQTDFYKANRDKIRIIAQFPIGEYIQRDFNRYIPKYRVDFLIILSNKGKEKTLILEYDGVEYHTKNPSLVNKQNFSQEYLDYDIQRQLELEDYGYSFLRINKFTLLPQEKEQTKIDVLNGLLTERLNFKEE